MAVLRSVPFAFLLAVITLLSYTAEATIRVQKPFWFHSPGMTSARSAALPRNSLAQLLNKRNSWWSKKSVDASSDFANIVPEANLDVQDIAENSSDVNTELFLCYMSSCVPNFTACATRSRTTDSFDVCRLQHYHCAVHCLRMVQGDSSSMK